MQFCRGILHGVDLASVHGLDLTVRPGSMEGGLFCEHFFKTLLSSETTVKSMLHASWTSVSKIISAEQKCSLQVLESSNNQDHADGRVEGRDTDASEKAIGSESNVACLHASNESHVAQVAIRSQDASQGTVVFNALSADLAMHLTNDYLNLQHLRKLKDG